jgi:MFS family permease
MSDNSAWLIGVQVLDGVGAGIFGALTPLVIADVMRGTGRSSLAQGADATAQGIGASLSGLLAGVVVDRFGYTTTFLTPGAAAAIALIVFTTGMPETANRNEREVQWPIADVTRAGMIRDKFAQSVVRQGWESDFRKSGVSGGIGVGDARLSVHNPMILQSALASANLAIFRCTNLERLNPCPTLDRGPV